MRATFRREPYETGLQVSQGVRGWILKIDGEDVAHVSSLHPRDTRRGWYWYGCGRNTADSPTSTAEEAKAECLAHCKKQLAANT